MKMKPFVAGVISKTAPIFGFYVRSLMRIPLMGSAPGACNKAIGRMLPHLSILGFKKEASFENAIWNWELFLNLIGADYEVEAPAPQERLYKIKKCPAGHCRIDHLEACKATMELDNSLVKRSGACLVVEKRFPIDGVCIERVVAIS